MNETVRSDANSAQVRCTRSSRCHFWTALKSDTFELVSGQCIGQRAVASSSRFISRGTRQELKFVVIKRLRNYSVGVVRMQNKAIIYEYRMIRNWLPRPVKKVSASEVFTLCTGRRFASPLRLTTNLRTEATTAAVEDSSLSLGSQRIYELKLEHCKQ
jgi:hypothetical protein